MNIRPTWIAVAALLCIMAAMPVTADAQGITQQQAEEMLKELRAIRQALERVTQPQAPEPAPDRRVTLDNPTGPWLGRADAPLTLVEFTDLQCPYCNRFTTTAFEQIKAAYIDTGKVRFISRDFPLDFHPQAMAAARASRCAGAQGKWWEMRMALLRGAARLSPAFITGAAADLKLDAKLFADCTASTLFDAEIQRDMTEARKVGVEGTPTFVLGRVTPAGLDGVV
ncbi:MAG: DsbA family protein, partial [Acidobacteria bacterium]|nr:DsbA family protein [Acidobacteriota bacterium]